MLMALDIKPKLEIKMLIKTVKISTTVATLLTFGSATFLQAADTWNVAGRLTTVSQADVAVYLHADEITWSTPATTPLASSHTDQVTWPVTAVLLPAPFSHADEITWECPSSTQVASLN